MPDTGTEYPRKKKTEGEGETLVTVVDGGRTFPIDLKLWYDTARDLGGFVWLEEMA